MKISVALCTYNGGLFLAEQLQSIFSQTHSVDEIIICDDGSTDNTIDIINQFSQEHTGVIKLYTNEKNLRVVKNFEKAISLCTGDLIFFCDQDDVWKDEKVKETLDFFEANPKAFGVFSDAELINDYAEPLSLSLWELLLFKEFAKPGLDILRYIILNGNVVTGACMAIKKEAVEKILPFSHFTYMLHDEIAAVKLAKENRMGLINKTLISYRLHKNQQTNPLLKKDRAHENETRRNIIIGNAAACPLDYYRYWKRRLSIIEKSISEGMDIDNNLLIEINRERKKGMIALLKTMSYIKRKRNLLRLFIDKQENISFADVILA